MVIVDFAETGLRIIHMAVPLEVKTIDNDARRSADPPPASPKQEATSSFLPAIPQQSEYIQLAKAGGHKGMH